MPALFTGQLHLSFYVATCILLKLPNGNAFYLSPGPQTLPADTLELNSHTKKKKSLFWLLLQRLNIVVQQRLSRSSTPDFINKSKVLDVFYFGELRTGK